jgi:hypothetical protein
MARCLTCGKDNPEKLKVCFWCGTELPKSEREKTPAPPAEVMHVPLSSEIGDEVEEWGEDSHWRKILAVVLAVVVVGTVVGFILMDVKSAEKGSEPGEVMSHGIWYPLSVAVMSRGEAPKLFDAGTLELSGAGTVELEYGAPEGVSLKFEPSEGELPFESKLKLRLESGARSGDHEIVIKANGEQVGSLDVRIVILPSPLPAHPSEQPYGWFKMDISGWVQQTVIFGAQKSVNELTNWYVDAFRDWNVEIDERNKVIESASYEGITATKTLSVLAFSKENIATIVKIMGIETQGAVSGYPIQFQSTAVAKYCGPRANLDQALGAIQEEDE